MIVHIVSHPFDNIYIYIMLIGKKNEYQNNQISTYRWVFSRDNHVYVLHQPFLFITFYDVNELVHIQFSTRFS